jgi:uncharacterized protein
MSKHNSPEYAGYIFVFFIPFKAAIFRSRRCFMTLDDIIARRLSRRTLLKGAAAGALAVSLAGNAAFALQGGASTLGFSEIGHGIDDQHHVARGYSAEVLIRWGDPVLKDAPGFDPAKQTASTQERQFGYNCDFVAFMPLPLGSSASDHGLLCVNHEYTDRALMFPEQHYTPELAAAEMAAHGHSVVEIKKSGGKWLVVNGKFNRRITAETPIRISGPAAGHERLKTKADPSGREVRGTIANCAGGTTPWGTVLSGEENTPFYFHGEKFPAREAANYKRLGIGDDLKFGWLKYHDRFNIDREPLEPNRFGWVVEIDPYDPRSTPVKRTALGRFRHEGAATIVNKDGRVVVYMGDDGTFEFIYKFVTAAKFDPHKRAANLNLLDDGTLYAARFLDDGRLQWLPLVHGEGPLTADNGFNDQGDVVIEARRAASLAGATPMDRPEDVEPDPVTGRVYAALTNNAARSFINTDAANPRSSNAGGHIIEMIPPGGMGQDADHAARDFTWEFFIIAGNPDEDRTLYGKGLSRNGWLACPDNVAFDAKGRIWIATDQGGWQSSFKTGDGLYAADLSGDGRAVTKFFYRVPVGAELCGPCFTPDNKTLFVAVQHPGEGSAFASPATRWPDFSETLPPRPSIVAVTKDDGGDIGD